MVVRRPRVAVLSFIERLENADIHPGIKQSTDDAEKLTAQSRAGEFPGCVRVAVHHKGPPRGRLESLRPTQETRLISMIAKAVQRHHFSFQVVFHPKDPDYRSLFPQAAAQGVGGLPADNQDRIAGILNSVF